MPDICAAKDYYGLESEPISIAVLFNELIHSISKQKMGIEQSERLNLRKQLNVLLLLVFCGCVNLKHCTHTMNGKMSFEKRIHLTIAASPHYVFPHSHGDCNL